MIDSRAVRIGIALLITLLSACGGRGGGGGSSPPPTYTVGGSVNGLMSSGLVLSNGVATLNVPANATSISFPTQLLSGASYSVSIVSQPLGFTDACSLSNASGTVGNAAIINVDVACHPAAAVVTTLAGNGIGGSANGVGAAASFLQPAGVAVDTLGNVFVADAGNQLIRKITSAGVVTTFAGSGNAGHADGTGTAASFLSPFGVTVDTMGNVFVAESRMIRKITSAGVVTTFAGSGLMGNSDGVGSAASFYLPSGVTVDTMGNVFVADLGNNVIRKITSAGMVTTFAGSGNAGHADGTGTAASFSDPNGLTVDAMGNIYVADSYNNVIRKIDPAGVVTTFAGSGYPGLLDSTGTAANFHYPIGVATDTMGNLYVADSRNNVIRKITSTGMVTTIAGSDLVGSSDGVGSAASFNHLEGVAVDNMGAVYVADFGNNLIRKISPQ